MIGKSRQLLRSPLSREKAAALIEYSKGPDGVTRYRMSNHQFTMGMDTIGRQNKQEFILAIFSFTKDASSQRSAVRETLKNYGFR
jgi:hypothetical protein